MTDNTQKLPKVPVVDLEPHVTDQDAQAVRGGFLGGLIKPVTKGAGPAIQSPPRTQ